MKKISNIDKTKATSLKYTERRAKLIELSIKGEIMEGNPDICKDMR